MSAELMLTDVIPNAQGTDSPPSHILYCMATIKPVFVHLLNDERKAGSSKYQCQKLGFSWPGLMSCVKVNSSSLKLLFPAHLILLMQIWFPGSTPYLLGKYSSPLHACDLYEILLIIKVYHLKYMCAEEIDTLVFTSGYQRVYGLGPFLSTRANLRLHAKGGVMKGKVCRKIRKDKIFLW